MLETVGWPMVSVCKFSLDLTETQFRHLQGTREGPYFHRSVFLIAHQSSVEDDRIRPDSASRGADVNDWGMCVCVLRN